MRPDRDPVKPHCRPNRDLELTQWSPDNIVITLITGIISRSNIMITMIKGIIGRGNIMIMVIKGIIDRGNIMIMVIILGIAMDL